MAYNPWDGVSEFSQDYWMKVALVIEFVVMTFIDVIVMQRFVTLTFYHLHTLCLGTYVRSHHELGYGHDLQDGPMGTTLALLTIPYDSWQTMVKQDDTCCCHK